MIDVREVVRQMATNAEMIRTLVRAIPDEQAGWQPKPKTMRISVTGARPKGVTAKDIILAIIGHIGAAGGTGHAI